VTCRRHSRTYLTEKEEAWTLGLGSYQLICLHSQLCDVVPQLSHYPLPQLPYEPRGKAAAVLANIFILELEIVHFKLGYVITFQGLNITFNRRAMLKVRIKNWYNNSKV